MAGDGNLLVICGDEILAYDIDSGDRVPVGEVETVSLLWTRLIAAGTSRLRSEAKRHALSGCLFHQRRDSRFARSYL